MRPPWRVIGSEELLEGTFDDVKGSRARVDGGCIFLEDEKVFLIRSELIIRR